MKKLLALIATPDEGRRTTLADSLKSRVSIPTTVYFAEDGREASAKLQNDPPHLVIIDFDIPGGMKITSLVDSLLVDTKLPALAIVLVGHPPIQELYIDELVTGKIQFLDDPADPRHVNHCITKALNFCFHGDKSDYQLRFLNKGDQLIKEGTPPDFVYLVKRGHLRAFKTVNGKPVEVGEIKTGEFVGEMAYINKDARSASVEATSECELIEIPLGTLDRLLYKRPSWSKTLMMTLSKRLSQANDKIAESARST